MMILPFCRRHFIIAANASQSAAFRAACGRQRPTPLRCVECRRPPQGKPVQRPRLPPRPSPSKSLSSAQRMS